MRIAYFILSVFIGLLLLYSGFSFNRIGEIRKTMLIEDREYAAKEATYYRTCKEQGKHLTIILEPSENDLSLEKKPYCIQ